MLKLFCYSIYFQLEAVFLTREENALILLQASYTGYHKFFLFAILFFDRLFRLSFRHAFLQEKCTNLRFFSSVRCTFFFCVKLTKWYCLHKGAFGLCVTKVCLFFLISTAFVGTKTKPRARRGKDNLFRILIQFLNNWNETRILTDAIISIVL